MVNASRSLSEKAQYGEARFVAAMFLGNPNFERRILPEAMYGSNGAMGNQHASTISYNACRATRMSKNHNAFMQYPTYLATR